VPLLQAAGLHEVFLRFGWLTQAPRDMSCYLLVARKLHDAFDILPNDWRDADAFLQWPQLIDFHVANQKVIREQLGDEVEPVPLVKDGIGHPPIHPLYGRGLERHALYAMLCDMHEVKGFRGLDATLQFQILYARWAELRDDGELVRDAQAWPPADPDPGNESLRCVSAPKRNSSASMGHCGIEVIQTHTKGSARASGPFHNVMILAAVVEIWRMPFTARLKKLKDCPSADQLPLFDGHHAES
jgi:hypothetical protein